MPPEWTVTLCYATVLVVSFAFMKVANASISLPNGPQRLNYVLFAPLLSVRVWNQRTPIDRKKFLHLVLRASMAIPTLGLVYWQFPALLGAFSLPWAIRSYLAVVPFVVLIEGIGVATQLASIPTCGALPPLLDRPYLSRNLAEFWGQRWNPWLGGWFWEVCFRRFRRQPELATMVAFGASGVWHELLVSVPLWIVFQENVFGFMLAYFLFQAGGVLVERRLGLSSNMARIWLWLVVLAPVPLVLNRGTLLIFHLSPP